MKYITVKEDTIVKLVIFSKTFVHSTMAKKVGLEVVGAGFISWDDKECFGESVSLDIKSHPNDTKLLRWMLGPYENNCPRYE